MNACQDPSQIKSWQQKVHLTSFSQRHSKALYLYIQNHFNKTDTTLKEINKLSPGEFWRDKGLRHGNTRMQYCCKCRCTRLCGGGQRSRPRCTVPCWSGQEWQIHSDENLWKEVEAWLIDRAKPIAVRVQSSVNVSSQRWEMKIE